MAKVNSVVNTRYEVRELDGEGRIKEGRPFPPGPIYCDSIEEAEELILEYGRPYKDYVVLTIRGG